MIKMNNLNNVEQLSMPQNPYLYQHNFLNRQKNLNNKYLNCL